MRPVVYLGEPCPHHAMQSCQSYLGFYGATENGREGQIPNLRGVAEHVSTGYNRVEGNLRASRNGLMSDLPPEIPTYDSQLFHPLPQRLVKDDRVRKGDGLAGRGSDSEEHRCQQRESTKPVTPALGELLHL